MVLSVTGLLTDDDVQTYRRDGLLHVKGVFTPEEVETARAGIQHVLDDAGMLAQTASGVDDPGRFVEDFRRWQEVPEIEQLALHSRVPEYAAELLGGEPVRFYHDHVLVKEGGTKQRTPWHQDQPYYNVDGHGTSAWIPVDPVPAAGCLQLVAGSHEGPWKMPRTFLDGKAKWFPEGTLDELPDIDADPAAFPIKAFQLSRAMRSSSTSSPSTAPRASRSPGVDGCCRCATWPRTPSTPRAAGSPPRPSTSSSV